MSFCMMNLKHAKRAFVHVHVLTRVCTCVEWGWCFTWCSWQCRAMTLFVVMPCLAGPSVASPCTRFGLPLLLPCSEERPLVKCVCVCVCACPDVSYKWSFIGRSGEHLFTQSNSREVNRKLDANVNIPIWWHQIWWSIRQEGQLQFEYPNLVIPNLIVN